MLGSGFFFWGGILVSEIWSWDRILGLGWVLSAVFLWEEVRLDFVTDTEYICISIEFDVVLASKEFDFQHLYERRR